MSDINTTLATLKTLFEAALKPTYAKIVDDYRTFPDKLETAVSLSFEAQLPDTVTTGGDKNYYDFVAVLGSQILMTGDVPTETELRTAEQALNDLEVQIYTLLGKGGNAYKSSVTNAAWMKVSFPEPSIHPPNFIDAPLTRYAELPFRLHMK